MKKSLLERLAERSVSQATERSAEIGDCLVWMGPVDDCGYGWTYLNGRTMRVHRAAYIARHGPPPPETPFVLHHCDNPPCWRDEHLYAGTKADNINDRRARGRAVNGNTRKTRCPAGHKYTRTDPKTGKRYCRPCQAANQAAYRERGNR